MGKGPVEAVLRTRRFCSREWPSPVGTGIGDSRKRAPDAWAVVALAAALDRPLCRIRIEQAGGFIRRHSGGSTRADGRGLPGGLPARA